MSEAKYWRSVRLHRQGRVADAERLLRDVVRQQRVHIAALLLLGGIALQTGRPQQGMDVFDTIIALQPDNADAWNGRATALRDLGRCEDALAACNRAIALKPDLAAAFESRATCLRLLGRPEEALASYDRAIFLRPDFAQAFANRAAALLELGRPADALVSYDRAIELAPAAVEVHNNRGNLLRDLGRPQDALASYDRAIALRPHDAVALNNRGRVLGDLGRAAEALADFDAALALEPDFAAAHYNRGNVLRSLERPEEAVASFDAAIALRPDFAEMHNNRGKALQDLGHPEEALASFDRALALNADLVVALTNRGIALMELGRHDDALRSFDRALALEPDFVVAQRNRGAALAEMGRHRDALASFDAAITQDPGFAPSHVSRGSELIALGRPEEALASFATAIALAPAYAPAFSGCAEVLADQGHAEEALASFGTAIALAADRAAAGSGNGIVLRKLGPEISARFGLAKFHAARNEHAAAFAEWRAAHRLLARCQNFSRADHRAFIDACIAIFDRDRLTEGPRARNADAAPVFVVGMPRSGTTLCEQILDAHGAAHGGGERHALGRAFTTLGGLQDGADAVAPIAALGADQLDAAAADYLAELHALAPDKARIIDKMPGNYQYLGLVGLILPAARIIHCERDPRDIGLSIFARRFQGNHGYAHNLADLGWTIAQQIRLMAHWKAALTNPILTLRLDDWVADFDGTVARVLDHLDLPPDANCARFHQSDRWVPTASRDQVRRPINAQGLGRWRAYEPQLAPLIAELNAAGALRGWPGGA